MHSAGMDGNGYGFMGNVTVRQRSNLLHWWRVRAGSVCNSSIASRVAGYA